MAAPWAWDTLHVWVAKNSTKTLSCTSSLKHPLLQEAFPEQHMSTWFTPVSPLGPKITQGAGALSSPGGGGH